MSNFQKVANDHSTRLDAEDGRLVLMISESVKIDLWGGGPNGPGRRRGQPQHLPRP